MRCPICGSTDVVAIIYGYPSYELKEAEDRGEVIIGGCVIEEPTHRCRRCRSDLLEGERTAQN